MLNPDDFYRALREVELIHIEAQVKNALAQGCAALEVLNTGLIAGMFLVGQEFKAGNLRVSDVLLAALNMQRGIEILKPFFPKEGQGGKGKVVLGTVKGDLHDMGKNLVSLMMVGYGFQVVDLGTDVFAENFLAGIREHNPQIVGLSAPLATTYD